jgi:hypothetical protein
MTFIAAKVFVSPDGAVWTDVSGHGAAVAVDGGERKTEGVHVFDSDVPIVSGGKREIQGLTVRYIYTEVVGDPFDILRIAHETVPGTIYVQYQPKVGGNWFKTGAGILVKPGYPGGEASSAGTVMSEFSMKCAELTEAAAST